MKTFNLFFLLFIPIWGICQDGQLDLSFHPPSNFNYSIESMAQQMDGKILVGGNFDDFQYLKRLNTDGSLDSGFSAPAPFFASMKAIVIQPDGKIVTGGVGPKDLVRLNTDGSMDATFDAGAGIRFGGVSNIILQDDGKIIVGGNFDEFSGTLISGMIRLNPDGSIDNSFDLGLPVGSNVRDFDIQADGKIIIAGSVQSSIFLKRFNTDNTEDASFNEDLVGADAEIYSINTVEDDKIIITGTFTSYNGTTRHQMARLNSNGSLDTSFESYNIPINNSNYTIFDAKELSEGQYLINGYFILYNELPSKYISKINNDGSIDETFNMGSGANATINSTYVQEDGKILIGGDFTSFNGTQINHLARLKNELLEVNHTAKNTFVHLYPNPIVEELTIDITSENSNQTFVYFYNVRGQLVKTLSLAENKIINCGELQSGVYLVKIKNGLSSFNTKLVKL